MLETLNILESSAFLKLLIFSASFLAIAALAFAVLPDEELLAAKKRLGVAEEGRKPQTVALLRWFRPLYTAIVPFISSREIKQRQKFRKMLVTANLHEEITPDEFIGLKFVMLIVVPLLVIYLTVALGIQVPAIFWPFVFIFGFFFPELWLWEKAKIRRREIVRSLPYTLDLLTLSVEAGLDFIAAIQRLTQKTKQTPLLTEFGHMLREIRLGTNRADALRNMSARLNIEEISSFITVLIQTDQMGSSIGTVLRAQAEQLRANRFQAAETAGAKASQQILLPLVLLIFPTIFIVLLAPTILMFVEKGFF